MRAPGFRETMTEVGDTLGGIPLIGSGIRMPFTAASDAGSALEDAGQSQQELIQQLALTLGVGVALLPILMILALWLVPRIRFARRAGRAKEQLRAGVGARSARVEGTGDPEALDDRRRRPRRHGRMASGR